MKPHLALAALGIFCATHCPAGEHTAKTPPPLESIAQAQDLALGDAPEAVQQRVLHYVGAERLQSLKKAQVNGSVIYEAQFGRENTELRLQMLDDGSPLGLIIAGNGAAVSEPAGAPRETQARPAPPTSPDPSAGASTEQLPDAVKQSLHQQLGEVKVLSTQTARLYDLNIANNGKQQRVRIAEDGTLLGFEDLSQTQEERGRKRQQNATPGETQQP